MTKIDLRPDCANCAALCCVALAFDRSSMFAIDKPAGQACPHLDDCGACTIHDEREARGFAGCIAFDCLGAGQRATQLCPVDSGVNMDGTLAKSLAQAFGNLLRAHEHLLLLDLAERLDMSHIERHALAELRDALVDAGIDGRKIAVARSRIESFLKGLKSYVDGQAIALR